MKSFHILTFGCQMNYADSARIKTILQNCWFSYEENIKNADIIILDTCSVRQKAEDKITGLMKWFDRKQKIWITGCMIQHNIRASKLTTKKLPETLKKWNFLWTIDAEKAQIVWLNTNDIDEIKWENIIPINNAFNPQFFNLKKTFNNLELYWRIDDTGFLPLILKHIWYDISYDKTLYSDYCQIVPETNTSMNTHHNKTAYIPISTWCSQFCSYCIVPFARWLEKYFPVEQIVNECKTHLQNGAEELVLLGQIVNKHPQFVQIIKEVLKLDWLKRLRYTSPYPTYYSDELLELHEREEKLCPHIHIPFQSWSDRILKLMNRGYDSAKAREFIDKIRWLKRDISITTDIIVWFCDETEEDFQQTLDLVEYWKFDMIYIWVYSTRPGTYAQKHLQDNVPYDIKQERRDRLNNLLNKTSKENNEKEVWNTRTALINSFAWTNKDWIYLYEWYTDNNKQIIISSKSQLTPWDFIDAKITNGVVFKLFGEYSN